MGEKINWIIDKEHCWFCKRTKAQVLRHTEPMGDLFDTSGSEKQMYESAFVNEGIDVGCYRIPVCVVCKSIIEFLALDMAEESFKDMIKNLTVETTIKDEGY